MSMGIHSVAKRMMAISRIKSVRVISMRILTVVEEDAGLPKSADFKFLPFY
jgi:hypothetical protein